MKDNWDRHPADDIRKQTSTENISTNIIEKISGKIAENTIAEKNVTDMNTTELNKKMSCNDFMRHLIDYSDEKNGRTSVSDGLAARMDEHAQTCEACAVSMEQDRMLDELLAEIAEADAQVVTPLEVQAAWRKAIRAEAAAQSSEMQNSEQSEDRKSKRSKIIRMDRWVRSVGSIAAALVVLVAGTLGARMNEQLPSVPQNDPSPQYMMNENDSENAVLSQNDGIPGIISSGYMAMGNFLQSDGSVDEQSIKQSGADTQLPGNAENTALMTAAENNAVQPVVIRSAQRVIHSQEYDRDVQWMGDLVIEYEAYYEEKSESAAAAQQAGRISSMVIRVPSDRLDDFLTEMDQLGTTVKKSEKAEDVTGRYMDSQSRLSALQQQKDKLKSMMDTAKDVQELIAVDAQMTDVISEMERIEGDLRRWQSQQSYSCVEVTISEVFEQPLTSEASIAERMKAGFAESVEWLKDFGRDALVVLVSMLPRLVIWVPAVVLVGALIYILARKKKQ